MKRTPLRVAGAIIIAVAAMASGWASMWLGFDKFGMPASTGALMLRLACVILAVMSGTLAASCSFGRYATALRVAVVVAILLLSVSGCVVIANAPGGGVPMP